MILDDVCELIIDTEHKTAPNVDFGIPSIRTPNVGKGRLILDTDIKFVDEPTFVEWTKRATPKKDDLIIAREAPVGNVAIVPDIQLCLGQRTVLARPDNQKVNPLYLCYYLLSPRMQHKMLAGSGGSTVAHLNMKDIRNLELETIPSIPIQRLIASILSAYDDLIENNLKRIKLLEEAAEIVYKGEFDFFKPSNEANRLPDGWKVQRADEIFRINIGKTPPREQSEWFNDIDSGVKWISIKDINNSTIFLFDTSETVTEMAVDKFNMNVTKVNTVILSFKLTVGKVAITTEEMVTNEAIAHFNIDDESIMNSEFIYFYLKNFPFDSLGSTSSIGTAINSKIVKAMPVLLPPKTIIQEFGKKVKPSFQMIKTLLKQNTNLHEARDILLPRLMSREIEVQKISL
jgi:type I restriction enzyme S subunit